MEMPAPEHDDTFDFLFKLILIGDSNVGKTCVIQNFKSGIFSEKQQNTIGVDFTVRTLNIEGKKVKVREETVCHSRQTHKYSNCSVWWENRWLHDIKSWHLLYSLHLGNKCDLEQEREVQFQEACNLAKQKGILAALETSAKDSQHVDEAFMLMARELLSRNGLNVQPEDFESKDTPRVLANTHTPEKKSCC
uniref:RAB19, member RAS onco family n=1 Tax=Neolamprologus brichardi TaxID=32507 RepID=A0A3Q4GTW8_NEOBR